MALKYHPDKNQDNPEATVKVGRIQHCIGSQYSTFRV